LTRVDQTEVTEKKMMKEEEKEEEKVDNHWMNKVAFTLDVKDSGVKVPYYQASLLGPKLIYHKDFNVKLAFTWY